MMATSRLLLGLVLLVGDADALFNAVPSIVRSPVAVRSPIFLARPACTIVMEAAAAGKTWKKGTWKAASHSFAGVVPLGVDKVVEFAKGKATSEKVSCGEMGTDECIALCNQQECAIIGTASVIRTVKLGLYFGAWFALSAGYNIVNKRVLNAVALPWLHSTATLGVGGVYVLFLWATRLRTAPKLNGPALRALLPIGALHAAGHLSAVLSFSAGAVSFTQIVKAAEPVFTCLLGAAVLKQAVSRGVALSLVPIVLGVSLASMTELSFTWVAFGAAMASNLAFASRNIYARLSLDKPKGENMTPENLYGVLTLIAFSISLPFALIVEGPKAYAALSAATMAPTALAAAVAKTGAYFYLYNEVAMLALNNVHPVTHAVANTIKRVVILLACLIVFRNPLTPLCAIGSAIAIGGSYLYSMAKQRERAAIKAA